MAHLAANFLLRVLKVVIDALFPLKCLVCGGFFHLLDGPKRQTSSFKVQNEFLFHDHGDKTTDLLFGSYLCSVCTADFVPIQSPICLSCGIMFRSKEGSNRICGDCITLPKRFRIARAPLAYDQALMNLIHCYKYSGKIQLAKPLGGLLLVTFHRYWDADNIDLLIPVPLYTGRFKQRGFNQAYLLIYNWEKIAKELNLIVPGIPIETHALLRNRSTAAQTGLGRKERMLNIKNAFGVRQPEKIKGKRILLVDDVYTTGATVDECSRVLLENGAKYVDVLTVARAM